MKGKAIILLMIFSFMAAFAGCAGSKTYLMDVRYVPGEKALPKLNTVGICPFEDARKEKGTEAIGVRYRPGNKVDVLAVKGISLSQSVTQAVEDYFAEKGFKVTDCKGWDRSPEGLDRVPTDLSLVIGGKIDSFRVEAKSGVSITNIRYTVKLEALIGKMGERKVVIRTIESSPTRKKVGFDPDKVKDELNSTLTEVIRELFK
jgi:uncharacterized lipoprotein YajG